MGTLHSFPERAQEASSRWHVNYGPTYTHGPLHFSNALNFTFNTPLTTIKLLWWKPKSDAEALATSFYII